MAKPPVVKSDKAGAKSAKAVSAPRVLVPQKKLVRATNLPKGSGAARSGKKIVKIYGAPKAGKTHGVAKIKGARWMVADPNCIPTLEQMGALPPPEDIHEVSNLAQCREVVVSYLDAAEENIAAGREPLGIPAFIVDSDTAISEWHQADTARVTSQRFLGDNSKENGWQLFNAQFGEFIDLLAELGRFTNVIIIGHAAPKVNASKGEYAGFQLPPAMGLKMGRAVNWILYQTMETSQLVDGDPVIEGLDTVVDSPTGKVRMRRVYNTVPYGGYTACAPMSLFGPTEPVDLEAMLIKAGVL